MHADAGKAEHAPKAASCVDPKRYTCSGDFDDKKGVIGFQTDLCTGDMDTLHCCEGTATKIPAGDELCTSCLLYPGAVCARAEASTTWLGLRCAPRAQT